MRLSFLLIFRKLNLRSSILAFAVGVLLLQYSAELPSLKGSALFLLPLLIIASTKTHKNLLANILRKLAILSLAGGLGFYWAAGFASLRLSNELPTELEGQDIRLVGVIASLPQSTSQGKRFEFDVERTIPSNIRIPNHISLNTYYDKYASSQPHYRAGEKWQLTVRLRKPHGVVNPYGFDFEFWALERNIRATGYVRNSSENRRLEEFVWRPNYIVEKARESIRQRFQSVLAERPYTGVLLALSIGDQSDIPQSQWNVFWKTGVGHLISISGLHITMLAALAAGAAGWLWRRTRFALYIPVYKVATLVGFIAALLYALLAGFSVPTQRTLYMLSVGAIALWSNRFASASTVLAYALLLVLLLDPWAILAPGFWLSFGAVAVIFYMTSCRRLNENWFSSAIRTQVAVTVGLIPLSLALFQQVSLISPLANAFAIPIISLAVVPITLLAVVIPYNGFLELAYGILHICMWMLNWLSTLPSVIWESHAPSWFSVALAIIGILWLLAPRGLPARWLGFVLLLPLFFIKPPRPLEDELWLTVLDVGQGLSAVVQTQNHTLLYDTGPGWGADTDSGSRIVVPHLRGNGNSRLQGMVVSHADNDHSGGALSILSNVDVNWLLSSLPKDSPIVAKVRKPIRCEAGQSWKWDGVIFEVLHPPNNVYSENYKTNDLSCVIKIKSRFGSLLLTGDIEMKSEALLLSRFDQQLQADVVIAPHHGSRTSSTEEFVKRTHPKITIFTVGYRNSFGHPRKEIVERYKAEGAKILRSDDSGAITVKLSSHGIYSNGLRGEQRRYWRSYSNSQ